MYGLLFFLWISLEYIQFTKGSPTKPIITGNVNVQVGVNVTLTCESNSTSAPSNNKKLPPLIFTWYRNYSKVAGFNSNKWIFNVEKRHKYNTNKWIFKVEKRHKYDSITCMSTKKTNSVCSEPFKLNPQYGPDTVTISPEIPDTVDVIEGKSFGPYTCSADCNPPCRYQWKRIKSGNQYEDVGTGPTLTISQVDKTHADRYRCRVDSDFKNSNGDRKAIKTVTLRVLYLSEPVLYIENGIMKTSAFGENVQLNLSCNVEGIPRPQVSILRDNNTLSTGNEWSNYTFFKGLQCEDTGNYSCAGKISMLEPKEKSFFINVLCSTRLDVASSPRSLYGSRIGKVSRVLIPVISNPKPDMPTWKKPANADIQTKLTQGSVVYRYVIESEIHIKEQSDFGNYTALVGDRELIIVTIKALLPPINVKGMAISATAIRLTWEANDESAPVTKYAIYQLFEASWQIIANAKAESNKKVFSYVVNQRLRPDRSYSFRIKSCNMDICSTSLKVLGVYTLGISSSNTVTSLQTTGVVVGIILAVLMVICLAVAIVVWNICRSKRASGRGIRQGVDNQRLPTEHIPDHHEYDFIDEGINSEIDQTESSMVPTSEQYQDVLGVIRAHGTGPENLQMLQYGNEGGCIRKPFTSETVDNGENEYESTCPNNDQSGRLYTALSKNDDPQSSLYTTL